MVPGFRAGFDLGMLVVAVCVHADGGWLGGEEWRGLAGCAGGWQRVLWRGGGEHGEGFAAAVPGAGREAGGAQRDLHASDS